MDVVIRRTGGTFEVFWATEPGLERFLGWIYPMTPLGLSGFRARASYGMEHGRGSGWSAPGPVRDTVEDSARDILAVHHVDMDTVQFTSEERS